MSTMIGVCLAILLLATLLLLFSAYAYKSRKACFKYRKNSGFGDETDTQNFRISYPQEQHYVSPSISVPGSLQEQEDRVRDHSWIFGSLSGPVVVLGYFSKWRGWDQWQGKCCLFGHLSFADQVVSGNVLETKCTKSGGKSQFSLSFLSPTVNDIRRKLHMVGTY